jgi:hypothetical protein
MGLEVLVPFIMGALLKVAGKVAEGTLSAVEDAASEGASGVFAKIRAWWSGDSSARDDLAKFESEPDIYMPVVEARLIKKLAAEPGMQAEFTEMMEAAGPQVDVFQRIAHANGITGAEVEEMLGGRLNVKQEIENAEDVTGVKIKRLD